jgi:multiple sugar transport system ATP-binding protein
VAWQAFAASLVGRDVEFGIRPEDVGAEAGGSEHSAIPAKVVVTQPLGAENLVTLQSAGGELTGRFASSMTPRPDDALTLHFDLSRMHLFDRDTGEALRP